MKRIVTIVLCTIFVSALSVLWTYSFVLISWNGGDVNPINEKDLYMLSDMNARVLIADRFSQKFTDGERFYITQNNNYSWFGFIKSDQYWDFYIKDKIIAKKFIDNSPNCSGKLEYKLSGNLFTPIWWFEVPLWADSFYCPETKKIYVSLDSSAFGPVTIANTETQETTVIQWKNIATSEIFNTNKIVINGLVHGDNTQWLESEIEIDYWDSATNKEFVIINNNGYSWTSNSMWKSIKKNIAQYTAWETRKTFESSLHSLTNKFHLYDYKKQTNTYLEHDWNKGKILTIWHGWLAGPGFDSIEVNGHKNIVVDGGNIYIKADIYNKDKNSLLVIIATRDPNNYNNGWNIYIHPNVTNIDALLVSEWSVLSYDWVNILSGHRELDRNKLRRQLYVYGSIISRNTLGSDSAPYNSDAYIQNNWDTLIDPEYNLENLRTFQAIRSDDANDLECNQPKKFSAMANESQETVLQYAFAGKKKCYISEPPINNLRETEIVSPLYIQFNPIINTSPSILIKQ